MKIPGKSFTLSESAKRNLCLLPAAVALFGVMLKDSCTARKAPPDAPAARVAVYGPAGTR